MVFGDLIGVKSRGIIRLDQLEAVFVGLRERRIGPSVEMVENAKIDTGHRSSLFLVCIVSLTG